MVRWTRSLEDMAVSSFWSNKRVLVTGHTGFKGSWLSLWLCSLGAEVFGLALKPETQTALFDQLNLASDLDHCLGDICDANVVTDRINSVRPDVVFHLAAQSLVLRSYDDPVDTWQTNVMGSINVMEAMRRLSEPCALVMITTDKVYENRNWLYSYREVDRLGGHDPYSASKAAVELAISSWRKSFLAGTVPVRMASARAGNVIGGGDWAQNRIMPDLIRSVEQGQPLNLRNPCSIRPWQHVLEPLSGYLRLARSLVENSDPIFQDSFNFGPEAHSVRTVRDLVETAFGYWHGTWYEDSDLVSRHEARSLSVNTEKARSVLGYQPRIGFAQAVELTVDWYKKVAGGADPKTRTKLQIQNFGPP